MPSIPNQNNRNDGLERELKVCRQLALGSEDLGLVAEVAVHDHNRGQRLPALLIRDVT